MDWMAGTNHPGLVDSTSRSTGAVLRGIEAWEHGRGCRGRAVRRRLGRANAVCSLAIPRPETGAEAVRSRIDECRSRPGGDPLGRLQNNAVGDRARPRRVTLLTTGDDEGCGCGEGPLIGDRLRCRATGGRIERSRNVLQCLAPASDRKYAVPQQARPHRRHERAMLGSLGIRGQGADAKEARRDARIEIRMRQIDRGQGRRRSVDLRFFRPALYRLSYLTSDQTLNGFGRRSDWI